MRSKSYIIILFSFILEPRKHWLLEDGPSDTEGGFINRHGPFQGSLNEGKPKHRHKKPSILKGIGHMFRFGKHRKDGVAPTETFSDIGSSGNHQQSQQQPNFDVQKISLKQSHLLSDRPLGGPPTYQPPPAPAPAPTPPTIPNGNSAIHHNDVFNHRYSHYVNYDELQQHIRYAKLFTIIIIYNIKYHF